MRTGEPMLRSLVSLAVVGSLMVAGPALQAVASPQRTQPVGTELRNTPVVLVGSDVKGLDAPPVARRGCQMVCVGGVPDSKEE